MLDVRSSCSRLFFSISFAVVTLLTFSSTLAAQTPTVSWNANTEVRPRRLHRPVRTQAGNPSTSSTWATSRAVSSPASRRRDLLLPRRRLQLVRPAERPVERGVLRGARRADARRSTLTSVSPTCGPTTGGTVITLNGIELRVRRDGARRRHRGDRRHVHERDAAARDDAGGHGRREDRAGHQPDAQSATLNNAFTYTAQSGADADLGVADVAARPRAARRSPSPAPTSSRARPSASAACRRPGVTFLSATQLRAQHAGRAPPGAKTVQVTNPTAQSATLNNAFTYSRAPAPTLTSVSPTLGLDRGRHDDHGERDATSSRARPCASAARRRPA